MGESSSAAKVRPAMLQIVDHRGNVVIVDAGMRLAGTITQVPRSFADGAAVEITLIVGFEPVLLRVAVVEGCDCRPGAIAVVSLVEWVAGGRHFRPDDGRAPAAVGADDDRVGLRGRLDDMSLVDVVQLLSSSQRSGVIEIRAISHLGTALPLGTLALRRGQVCFADFDGDRGEEAFFALLGVVRGSFAVQFEATLPSPNIERETTFLLLEHLRRVDESSRIPVASLPRLESVPDGNVVVRPAMAPTVAIPPALVVIPYSDKLPGQADKQAEKQQAEKLAEKSAAKAMQPPPKKKKRLPSHPERDPIEPRTGRFSRFFDEVSSVAAQDIAAANAIVATPVETMATKRQPPPPPVDDAELPATDQVRFTSLAVTMTNTGGPFERDTDIVDRALISA